MLKKYIVAEAESNLMATEINSAWSAIYIRTIVHSKYTHHYDEWSSSVQSSLMLSIKVKILITN